MCLSSIIKLNLQYGRLNKGKKYLVIHDKLNY